jgi:hypothetical protein
LVITDDKVSCLCSIVQIDKDCFRIYICQIIIE